MMQEHNQDVEYDKFIIISEELKRYKKEYGLIEFNDMILDSGDIIILCITCAENINSIFGKNIDWLVGKV